MIEKIRKYLSPSSNRKLVVESNHQVSFKLLLDNLDVGILKFEGNTWEFKYTEDFKAINDIKPLADFPEINKIYTNKELWPFFSSRIPSLARNRIRTVIKNEGIKETDLLALLSRFGKQTITNPFVLEAQ